MNYDTPKVTKGLIINGTCNEYGDVCVALCGACVGRSNMAARVRCACAASVANLATVCLLFHLFI